LKTKLFDVAIAKTGDCGFEGLCLVRGPPMSAIASHARQTSSRRHHAALRARAAEVAPALFERRGGVETALPGTEIPASVPVSP
jgi:hypothetical protein